jgi:predicted DNA-binding transcriptional regulator YafY
MSNTNQFLVILEIVEMLGEKNTSVSEIQEKFDISFPTIRRHIAEARHLGADIESIRQGAGWVYKLKNWPACQKIVTRWIELERNRSFL